MTYIMTKDDRKCLVTTDKKVIEDYFAREIKNQTHTTASMRKVRGIVKKLFKGELDGYRVYTV